MSASDLLACHKKERKELLNKIQEMKHSIPKGDKKKKREVLAQIAILESEMDERHANELKQIENATHVTNDGTPVDLALSLGDLVLGETNDTNDLPDDKSKRISKAQKRRDKKVAKLKERDEAIAQQDIENLSGGRNVEKDKFDKVLSERGLAIHEVPSDGDCLYKAVEHQLSILNLQETNVQELRQKTCDYMLSHREDFMPFLIDPDADDVMSEEQYDAYCQKIKSNPTWGGHVEVQALSNICDASIEVIQADGPSIIAGHNKPSKLMLSYHRHMYGLGEHYNSIVPKTEDDLEDL